MNSKEKIHEKFFADIWKQQTFEKEIKTLEGESIQILSIGEENKEHAGPDFCNARIKIGNITYVGDVEIDTLQNDWKNHGHLLNKRFNKVILHTIFSNDTNHTHVFTQNGRKIPTLAFGDYLSQSLSSTIKAAIKHDRAGRTNKIPCTELSDQLDEKAKLEFLEMLGTERFKKKCERIIIRFKELVFLKENKVTEPLIHYSLPKEYHNKKLSFAELNDKFVWEQIIYELIFEALGYTKNKNIMQHLAQAVNLTFLRNFIDQPDFRTKAEAAYFSVGGLIPDVLQLKEENTSEYTRKLFQTWQEIRSLYDGETFHETEWHFFQLRPQNFPTVRIAGGVVLVEHLLKHSLIAQIIKKINEIHKPSVLIQVLRNMLVVKADGYWKDHYIFDKPSNEELNYFVGSTRVEEILINVIFPFAYVYFDLFNKKYLAQKTFNAFSQIYLTADNNLVKEISESLDLNNHWRRAVLNQGMLELFRNYCSKARCKECKIGIKVFSTAEANA
ncbi:MAG: DUF2851 family protein [Ignavibacteria bacterium]|nr:DUF2851 family protein [Ignavibacteria bacterium]